MINYLNTLFSYNNWANRQAMDSVCRANSPPSRAWEVMSHIVGCEWLWIGRLKRETEPAIVWPNLTENECARQLDELARLWNEFLTTLTRKSLLEEVKYTNSQGEVWANNVRDMLMHVVLHSGYHRGQIATLLGRAGHESAYTDFIHCIRQGYIEERDET